MQLRIFNPSMYENSLFYIILPHSAVGKVMRMSVENKVGQEWMTTLLTSQKIRFHMFKTLIKLGFYALCRCC